MTSKGDTTSTTRRLSDVPATSRTGGMGVGDTGAGEAWNDARAEGQEKSKDMLQSAQEMVAKALGGGSRGGLIRLRFRVWLYADSVGIQDLVRWTRLAICVIHSTQQATDMSANRQRNKYMPYRMRMAPEIKSPWIQTFRDSPLSKLAMGTGVTLGRTNLPKVTSDDQEKPFK